MQYLPYGKWTGKISPELVANRGRISTLKWDPEGEELVFSVSAGGKSFLYKKAPFEPLRQINGDLPVYGGVGYGGGDFDIRNGVTVFCAGDEGLRLHSGENNGSRKLTLDELDRSTPVISPDGKYVAYVTSDDIHDQIALLRLDAYDWPRIWISGADFYMQPEWSPDGRHFAWVEWNHPEMPWTGSTVKMATIDTGNRDLFAEQIIAGGTTDPATQPHFSPDGKKLAYVEACGDWENLMILDLDSGKKTTAIKGDGFALSVPAFVQGTRSFAWMPDGKRIVYCRIAGTVTELWLRDLESGEEKKLSPESLTSIEQITVSRDGRIAVIAAGPLDFQEVIIFADNFTKVVYRLNDMKLTADFISMPQEISWKAKNGDTVHGVYYPPCNPDFAWHGAPPVIVQIHGGPTGKADLSFSAETAYFTSLGYAYMRVNYRGSTGYGRSYIRSLDGHWGEYDTEDAVTCVKYLAEQGLADGSRTLITGGSSGGYAVLNVLTQYPDAFTAGASLYGVSDLYGMVADTHKLELHYVDSLVGTLPEANEKFIAWSPIFHVENIRVPLAIFQGDRDKVVPPEQSEGLLNRLNVPVVFRLYEGEGHGFHEPEHIHDYLETLHKFLQDYV